MRLLLFAVLLAGCTTSAPLSDVDFASDTPDLASGNFDMAPRDLKASHVVAHGKPYREILRRAADDRSDLIVIGVHSGLADRLHIGSTTNHIVRGAVCPVLSLRG